MSDYHDHRREYGGAELHVSNLPDNPIILLETWLNEALVANIIDSTAFVLATSSPAPDARVVLLKEITKDRLVFYTNYQSAKAEQMALMPEVAGCFFWAPLSRQVRFQGHATKVEPSISSAYFKSRPISSQKAAIISPQSKTIPSRQYLEDKIDALAEQDVVCPDYWGGYAIELYRLEFFQGRESRLHDRFCAQKDQSGQYHWSILAP